MGTIKHHLCRTGKGLAVIAALLIVTISVVVVTFVALASFSMAMSFIAGTGFITGLVWGEYLIAVFLSLFLGWLFGGEFCER